MSVFVSSTSETPFIPTIIPIHMVVETRPKVSSPKSTRIGSSSSNPCHKCGIEECIKGKIFCQTCMNKILNVNFVAPTVNVVTPPKPKAKVESVKVVKTVAPKPIVKTSNLRLEQLNVLIGDDKVNIARYGNLLEKYITELKKAQESFMKHLSEYVELNK